MKYTGKPTAKKNPESLVGYDTPSLVGTPPAQNYVVGKIPTISSFVRGSNTYYNNMFNFEVQSTRGSWAGRKQQK